MIFWHDIINNSISKHRSNNHRAISVEKLLQILRDFSHRNKAVVYCRRDGAPDFFRKLLESKITILDVKSNLLSNRKSEVFRVLHDLKQTHLSTELEFRLLSTVWRQRKNLKIFKRGTGRSQNRASQRRKTRHQGEKSETEERIS